MQNIKDTIFSQYANSPNILKIISGLNDVIDPQYYIEDFYNYVYRLSSAQGFALDIWAIKVGVSRSAPMSDPNSLKFGYSPAYQPFNTYPFSGTGSGFVSYQLPDDLLRQLIIVKAALNILYATAININKFLLMVFDGRRAYYNITGHMTAEYVFEFTLSPFERMIVYTLKMLPQPCGVGISYIERDPNKILGFNGSGLQTFNNGVFANA